MLLQLNGISVVSIDWSLWFRRQLANRVKTPFDRYSSESRRVIIILEHVSLSGYLFSATMRSVSQWHQVPR